MIFFNVSWFIVWPESYFNQGIMYQGIKFVNSFHVLDVLLQRIFCRHGILPKATLDFDADLSNQFEQN